MVRIGCGRGTMEVLADRVRAVSRSSGVPFDEAGIVRVVTDAVVLANRDVASFSEPDPGTFLSTTWLLIEESLEACLCQFEKVIAR